MRPNREYSSAFRSFVSYRLANEIPQIFKTHFKRPNIKLLLLCLLAIILYSSTRRTPAPKEFISLPNPLKVNRTKPNAFIITKECDSLRYNLTKSSIELAFPDFFCISCYPFVPLDDSRIHTSPLAIVKTSSSNLLTFLDLWTYKIPKESTGNEYEWSFIFEDDVNFLNATLVSLPNFIVPLQELMKNPEIEKKHGFFYLGICGPSFDNDTQPLISKNTEEKLVSQKGCGFCRHATAITAKRSASFWTEISSYRPDPEGFIDKILHDYCVRSGKHFYTFGTNFHFPPSTGHMGIAYQDVGRVLPTTN